MDLRTFDASKKSKNISPDFWLNGDESHGMKKNIEKKQIQETSQQTFQVPTVEVLTYSSCMDTAYVSENPPPK